MTSAGSRTGFRSGVTPGSGGGVGGGVVGGVGVGGVGVGRRNPKPLADVGGPGLGVVFCGINPSLRSAESGHHFARPGNRFWPALHGAGFTPRRLDPGEDGLLPRWGVGITNVCPRPTRAADELSRTELLAGFAELETLAAAWAPGIVAVVGIGAWRTCTGDTGDTGATVGPQDRRVGGRPAWVLPNPSGLNAHYQLPDLVRHFAALRRAVTEDIGSAEVSGPPAS